MHGCIGCLTRLNLNHANYSTNVHFIRSITSNHFPSCLLSGSPQANQDLWRLKQNIIRPCNVVTCGDLVATPRPRRVRAMRRLQRRLGQVHFFVTSWMPFKDPRPPKWGDSEKGTPGNLLGSSSSFAFLSLALLSDLGNLDELKARSTQPKRAKEVFDVRTKISPVKKPPFPASLNSPPVLRPLEK